jgi:nitrogenase-stabilizing/protective protein
MSTFLEDLEDLESAEDLLNYFDIAYDPNVVHVNRLHILQRFHDYLQTLAPEASASDYHAMLQRAYNDFVTSDAQTEKVFKVFHMFGAHTAYVPLDSVRRLG